MGHWSEMLVDEVVQHVGPDADPAVLKALLREAACEIELLSGRTFGQAQLRSETLDSGGFPFAEVEDAHLAGFSSDRDVWPIPDPANPAIASVVQVMRPAETAATAMAAGQALWVAGQFVASAVQAQRLDPRFILAWLGRAFDPERRTDYLRQALDPTSRLLVPVAAASLGGWWFQITRRLRWLTRDSVDDHRLVQVLIEDEESLRGLVGVEPVLIAARMTEHPVSVVFSFRIWHRVNRDVRRPWRHAARAIHGHGIPIVTIDDKSTANEIACQLVLISYWHRYLAAHEPVLGEALAAAYPKAVARVQRGARLPDMQSAAALLMEGLLHPGFDPGRGAEFARRYVSRKATIAVAQQLKMDAPGLRAWETLGMTERSYYKLLSRMFPNRGGRYRLDADEMERVRALVDAKSRQRAQHDAAMQLLQERGFSYEAARKCLQRNPIERAVNAFPRRRPLPANEHPKNQRVRVKPASQLSERELARS